MKPKHPLRSFLAITGSALLFVTPAQAVDYYWDSNGTTSTLGNTGGLSWQSATTFNYVSLAAGNGRTVLNGTLGLAATATTTSDSLSFGIAGMALGATASNITVSGTQNIGTIVFGSSQSNAITLSGGTAINFAAAGSIVVNNTSDTVSTAITGAATSLTKSGSGTLNLTGASTFAGTVIVTGGGILNLGDGSTGSLASTTNALTFNTGGGTFNVAEAAGSTEAMGALTFTAGDGTVKSTYGGSSNSAITFSSLVARAAGASGNFIVSGGSNGSTNKISITGASTGFMDKGLFFGGSSYAAYDASGYVRGLIYGTDTNAATSGTITAGNHVQLTTSPSNQNSISLLSLNLSGGGVDWTQNASQTLTVPAILKSGGGAVSTISGGTSVTTASNAELVIRTDSSSDLLTISSPVTGFSGGLTKTGAGTLTLSGTNGYTGTTNINTGTLEVSGGNAIADTTTVNLANAPGATLKLSGNETINSLTGGGLSGGTVDVQGNTLTIGATSSFGGQFTGTSGGGVVVSAGTLTLSNKNTFAGTITLNGTSQLTLTYGNDGSSSALALSSGGAINMAGGTNMNLSHVVNISAGVGGSQLSSPNGWTIGNAIKVTSGTATVRGSGNDNQWTFSGGVTGSSTPSTTTTLAIASGYSGATSDRGSVVVSGVIADGSGGALGVNASFWMGTASVSNFINLTNQNTFTGPIAVTNSNVSATATSYLGIGGTRNNSGATTGSGYIGGGNYTNTISLGVNTTLNYLSSANQTLGGVISGAGAILKEGSGTLTLSASNSYTGTTTIAAGTLSINSIASVSGGNSAVGAPTSAAAGTIGIGSTTTAGQLTYTGSAATTDRVINLAGTTGGATIDQSGSGLLKFTSALTATGGGSKTLTLQGSTSGTGEIAGAIVDNSGTNKTSLAKSGTGTWTLSGANTYTGITTINGGLLLFAKQTSLYNNTTASWTAANINVKSGGGLGLSVGGTGEFTTTNITTLLTNLAASSSATNGMNAGSGFAFDTTNASGGTFTIADVIANSSGASGGARGVTKLGTGTLVLTNTNTYTGATTVTAGTLQVDGSTSAGSTVNIGTSGALTGTGTINGAVNVTGNGVINKSSGTIAGNLGVTGGNWNGNGTVSGTVTSSSGTFTIGSGANLTATGGVAITGGTLVAGNSSSTITGNLNYTSAANSTFAGVIAGSGNTLTMNNAAAKLTLSGTNTYNGTTTVSAGALAVNGSLANTATTVGNTGTLQGSGIIGGSVTIQSGGTLAPGNSIESLGTGALSFEAGSTYAYELQTNLYAGTPGVAGDLTFSSGTLDIQAGSILTLTDLAASTALAAGSKLTLISYFGGWTSGELFSYDAGAGLTTLADGATFTLGANQWRFDYNDITGGLNYTGDQAGATSFVTMTVVPEPGAALIGSLGLLALLRRRRHD